MKKIQIEKLLKGVIHDFTDSSDLPGIISNTLKEKAYITGGCIPSMISDQWVNDFDIYLKDKESVDIIKTYFTENKNSYNKDRKKYKCNLITDNAINLSDKIQIITKWYGEPKEVVNNFDWAHIKSFYDIKEGKLTLCDNVYQLIVEKELKYTGSKYPLSSLFRLNKYIAKGWTISNFDLLKIIMDTIKVLTKKNNISKVEAVKASEEEEFNAFDTIEESQTTIKEENKIYNSDEVFIDKDTLIEQMNGVDPLTIQNKLYSLLGESATLDEIINILNMME
jgi:hypothetical protein